MIGWLTNIIICLFSSSIDIDGMVRERLVTGTALEVRD